MTSYFRHIFKTALILIVLLLIFNSIFDGEFNKVFVGFFIVYEIIASVTFWIIVSDSTSVCGEE